MRDARFANSPEDTERTVADLTEWQYDATWVYDRLGRRDYVVRTGTALAGGHGDHRDDWTRNPIRKHYPRLSALIRGFNRCTQRVDSR